MNFKLFLPLFFLIGFSANAQHEAFDSLRMVLPIGHNDFVEYATFIRDDKKVITSDGLTTRIWDAASGKLLHTLEGNSNSVSNDYTKVITVCDRKTVRIWDALTGKILNTLYKRTDCVKSATFNSDNTKVITYGDSTVCIWDAASGELLQNLDGHTKYVRDAVFGNNGKLVLTICRNYRNKENTVRVWDIISGELLNILEGHTGWVKSPTFSSDDTKVVTASGDSTARIWDAASGELLLTLEGHNDFVYSATFSSDDTKVLTASGDNTARIWDAASGELLDTLKGGYRWGVNSATFSNDDTKVITSGGHVAHIWDAASGKLLHTLKGHTFDVKSATFSSDDSKVITASNDHTARIWDALSGKLLHTLEGKTEDVYYTTFSNDDKKVITASFENQKARIWDASSGNLLQTLEGHKFPVLSAAFSGDDKKVITGSNDKTARIWDASTGKLLLTLKEHNDYVYSATFSSDDKKVLTCSYNGSVYIWDAESGKLLNTFEGHEYANLSRDDKKVITVLNDTVKNIWSTCILDVDSGKLLMSLEGRTYPQNSASFSSDDKKVITSTGFDETARIWDAASGELLLTLEGHNDPVYSATFSSDDTKVLTASGDNTARIWDAASGELLQTLEHASTVQSANFSNDGTKAIVASIDHKTILWDVTTGNPICERIQLKNNNWLVKLPNSPYYMCSKDASKMLHYVTPSNEIVGFEQLDPIYNRPDIVFDSIGQYFGGADQEELALYRTIFEKRMNFLGLDSAKIYSSDVSFPKCDLKPTNEDYNTTNGIYHFQVSASDQRNALKSYNVYVNEVPVYGAKGLSLRKLKEGAKSGIWKDSVGLNEGRNKIQVSVMNAMGLESFKYSTYVNYTPPSSQEVVSTTHFIGIGVNKFEDSTKTLKYCVGDIQDLAQTFGGVNTKTKLFTNETVTRENIAQLKTYLRDSTTIHDKVILSISTHGEIFKKDRELYLATHDMNFDNPASRGIKYAELEAMLDGIPARKKLLLLDACNSGGIEQKDVEMDITDEREEEMLALNENQILYGAEGRSSGSHTSRETRYQKMLNTFVNTQNNTGTTILAAAQGGQKAWEGKIYDEAMNEEQRIENGMFTYVIKNALQENPEMTLQELIESTVKGVARGSKNTQNPMVRCETMENDWKIK